VFFNSDVAGFTLPFAFNALAISRVGENLRHTVACFYISNAFVIIYQIRLISPPFMAGPRRTYLLQCEKQ